MNNLTLLNKGRLFDLSYVFWWMIKHKHHRIEYQKHCILIDGEIIRYNDAAKIFSDRFFLKNESGFSVTVSKDELLISKE